MIFLDYCSHSSRLYRVNDAAAVINISDPLLITIGNIFDGIHHYMFYLFESGLRSIEDDHDDVEQDETKEDEYYDYKGHVSVAWVSVHKQNFSDHEIHDRKNVLCTDYDEPDSP